MIGFLHLSAIGVTDIILIVGVAGYLLERLLEVHGWSRSARTLRRENEDLIRRNGELEDTVARHEKSLEAQAELIARMQSEVDDLKKRDVGAVLAVIHEHELHAQERAVNTQGLLERIALAVENRGG